jgi:hypothetical protein
MSHSSIRWPLVHYRLELVEERWFRPFCNARDVCDLIPIGEQLAREGADVWVSRVPAWCV